jgi:hypothetical protein
MLDESDSTLDSRKGRTVKPETIEWEVKDIRNRYRKWKGTVAETARGIIDLGERLTKLKGHVRAAEGYGSWEGFVEPRAEVGDLPPLRTCQKFMAGWADRDNPLLGTEPAAWVARVWGNRKVKSAVDGASAKRSDDNQSGGPGFNPSFDPAGKPGLAEYAERIKLLNEAFLANPEASGSEKRDFLVELVRWCQAQLATLTNEAEEEANQ